MLLSENILQVTGLNIKNRLIYKIFPNNGLPTTLIFTFFFKALIY